MQPPSNRPGGTRLGGLLRTESGSGALLVVAAVVALIWANSPWSAAYDTLWHTKFSVGLSGHSLGLDLRHWVNDAAMTLFFLVVGLEIKREVTSGHLVGRRAAALPVAAALGGMVVPALLYLAIAGRTDANGWGVPMATDIALAVGIVALAGTALPTNMRATLLGLAVVDDIGAIVVIALFYSSGVDITGLAITAAAIAAVGIARRAHLTSVVPYVVLGAVAWLGLHEAGVHPTLAGVAMGLLTPTWPRGEETTIEWLEQRLHPWSAYLVVPVFAIANAGIPVSTSSLRDAVTSPIAWGIAIGLMVGKPLGVVLTTRLAVRVRLADAPAGARPTHVLGVGAAAGIGFTVAIFIAELAFRPGDGIDAATASARLNAAKLAILVASLVSGIAASALLRRGQSSSSPATSASPSR